MTPYITAETERLWRAIEAHAKTHPELRDNLREMFDETIKFKMVQAIIDARYFDLPIDVVFNNPRYNAPSPARRFPVGYIAT
jgi:hypothetical protein